MFMLASYEHFLFVLCLLASTDNITLHYFVVHIDVYASYNNVSVAFEMFHHINSEFRFSNAEPDFITSLLVYGY